jgi:isoleucyl-tRNA synthetase
VKLIDNQLIKDMEIVRQLVEIGHAKRKDAAIKLRQPLSKFEYSAPEKLSEDLEKILAEELNVKEIEYQKSSDGKLGGKMDTEITPLLQAEGKIRELIRQIQQLRKDQGLTLNDKISVFAPDLTKDEKLLEMIKKQTNAVEISSADQLGIKVN